MAGFNEFLFGQGQRNERLNTKTDQQIAGQGKIFNYGLDQLKNNNFSFDKIRENANRNFETKTLPLINERYGQTLQGDERRKSSGYADIMGQAGNQFDRDLAGLESEHQRGLLPFLQSLLGMGTEQNFQNQTMQGREGLAQPLLRVGGDLLTAWLTGGMSIPGSAAKYAKGSEGSSFNNQNMDQGQNDQIRMLIQQLLNQNRLGGMTGR